MSRINIENVRCPYCQYEHNLTLTLSESDSVICQDCGDVFGVTLQLSLEIENKKQNIDNLEVQTIKWALRK